MKKLAFVLLGLLMWNSVAQADVFEAALGWAIRMRRADLPIQEKGVYKSPFQSGADAAMTRYYANEILNAASMLVVLAMSADGGQGKDMTYEETELPANLPCQAKLFSTKEGVVDIILGESCEPRDPSEGKFNVRPAGIIKVIKEVGAKHVISCQGRTCRLNMVKGVR